MPELWTSEGFQGDPACKFGHFISRNTRVIDFAAKTGCRDKGDSDSKLTRYFVLTFLGLLPRLLYLISKPVYINRFINDICRHLGNKYRHFVTNMTFAIILLL